MAFIRVIGEDEAEGPLWDVYDSIQKSRGRLSNVLRIQSLDPKGLRTHLDLYMALLYGKGPLTRRQRELLAVVVSAENGCEYCEVHHGEALKQHVDDVSFLEQAREDYTKLDLDEADRALCDFAIDLTRHPGKGREKAVEALRKAGFEDDAVLQAVEITAYFNFVNRLASGLGVELEEQDDRDYHY